MISLSPLVPAQTSPTNFQGLAQLPNSTIQCKPFMLSPCTWEAMLSPTNFYSILKKRPTSPVLPLFSPSRLPSLLMGPNSLLNLLPAPLGDSLPPHLILSTASTSHSSLEYLFIPKKMAQTERGFRPPLPVIAQDSLHAREGTSVASCALTARDGGLQMTGSDSLTHPFAMLQLSSAHLCIQSCSLPAEYLLPVYPQINPTVPGAPYHRCPTDLQRPQGVEGRVYPCPVFSHTVSMSVFAHRYTWCVSVTAAAFRTQ